MSDHSGRRYDPDHMTTLERSFAHGLPYRSHWLEEGQLLFSTGQRPARLFLVTDGCVRLVRPSRTGVYDVMQRARAGEWLAESSLFSDRYHCNAVAQASAKAVSVSKRELLNSFRDDPSRGLTFCELLADHLRRLRAMHEIVRIRGARDRVLQWLLLNASGKPATLQLDQSWTEIADEIALTREAVYRAVGELKRRGAIRQRGQTLVLDSTKCPT
jgi:CRP/FNR family transcriptional regulator, dissimilatory nitrate respiration regulator